MQTSRPLRVVLATVGSRGDVQPMLALAQVLARRGHDVVVAAPPDFEVWVRSYGIAFSPVGADMRAFAESNPATMRNESLRGVWAVRQFLREQIPLQARELGAACEGADLLVFAGLMFAAPSLAQHRGLRSAGVLYTTAFIPSPAHAPMTIPWRGLPRWANRLLWKIDAWTLQRLVGRPVNEVRRGWKLPPVRLLASLWDQPVLVAADTVLFPIEADIDARCLVPANYLYLDDPSPLDPELDAWLAAGEPPVYIGFGSMLGEGALRAARVMVEGLQRIGRRCLVSAGWAGLGTGGGLPEGWRVVGDAPHAKLFPRLGVVVHHGGSGTTGQALRAGVPQVILPFILDQFHHAHVLHRAGIVPKPVPVLRITADVLERGVREALALPAAPREAAARRLQASDAREDIARWIEAQCQPRAVDHQLPEATTSESNWISPS